MGNGGAYKEIDGEEQGLQRGRLRIYTDVDEITEDNIIQVLREALEVHRINRHDIRWLLEYEKGKQELPRPKKIRADINIIDIDNVANQVVEFKLGYQWAQPIIFIQRSDKDIKGSDDVGDDDAVSMLNQMNDLEMMFDKDQELARYVEICGIGYQMVDIKRDYTDGDSVFDLHTLNPLNTFIVYRNDVANTPMLGVTYKTLKNGDSYYTCYTNDAVYIVSNVLKIINDRKTGESEWKSEYRSGEKNPLGKIPIVECIRCYERMGCFERQIPEMAALNAEVSDFANNVSQVVQEMWWGNDFEFPVDADGKPIPPVSGQWVMTKTSNNGTKPTIQPLTSSFDYAGVQQNILKKREMILQKCYVPLQTEPGGGSTGTAYSMSSGWSAAEAVAAKQENLTKAFKMKIVTLELLAINNSYHLPQNHILRKLKPMDVVPKFTRQKNYDMGTKVNALATMLSMGINGRIAMQVVDLFPDVAQAWADSKDMIESIQRYKYEAAQEEISENPKNQKGEDKPELFMQDISMQTNSSPFVGSI